MATREVASGGCIPFRIRIGVTGHRALEDEDTKLAGERKQAQAVAVEDVII